MSAETKRDIEEIQKEFQRFGENAGRYAERVKKYPGSGDLAERIKKAGDGATEVSTHIKKSLDK